MITREELSSRLHILENTKKQGFCQEAPLSGYCMTNIKISDLGSHPRTERRGFNPNPTKVTFRIPDEERSKLKEEIKEEILGINLVNLIKDLKIELLKDVLDFLTMKDEEFNTSLRKEFEDKYFNT
jgi:hypothetical protein